MNPRLRKPVERWDHKFGDDQAFGFLRAMTRDLQEHLTEETLTKLDGVIRSKSVGAYIKLGATAQAQLYLGELKPEVLQAEYMISSVLKKFNFSKTPFNQRDAAIQKWVAAERSCRRANKRIRHFLSRPSRLARRSPSLPGILSHARWYVEKVLGSFENFSLLEGRHGPGSSLCTEADKVTWYYKYHDLPYSVTDRAMQLARDSIAHHEQWVGALERRKVEELSFVSVSSRESLKAYALEDVFRVVDSNRLTFVPKDAKSFRPIAIEPRMNLYLQLSVHDYLVRRLKKFGVDIRYGQTERNQILARKGSVPGPKPEDRLATVDLSSASDCVSYELVKWILPPDWFKHLDLLRAPKGVLDGKEVVYEKFSSMGNGFTFALESLIFFALTKACMHASGHEQGEFAIYGDDIICPAGATGLLFESLRFLGFSSNTEKTFVFGDFRESCGTDYHQGVNIRPLFVRDISNIPSLFGLCNRLLHATIRSGGERTYYNAYRFISGRINTRRLLFGPLSREPVDSHLESPLFVARPRVRWDKDCQAWKYRRVVCRPRTFRGIDSFRFIGFMAGVSGAKVTQRNKVACAVTWAMSSSWSSFGWCPASMRYFL